MNEAGRKGNGKYLEGVKKRISENSVIKMIIIITLITKLSRKGKKVN